MKHFKVKLKFTIGEYFVNDNGIVVKTRTPVFKKYLGMRVDQIEKALKLQNAEIMEMK